MPDAPELLVVGSIALDTREGPFGKVKEELGRSWMEMEEYSGVEDFLEKLRYGRHVVTASSGTGRRA